MCAEESKGMIVHNADQSVHCLDLTNNNWFLVARTRSSVTALDVDSIRRHVYWIDGTRMRRTALNGNATLTALAQDMCAVKNAQGLAYDWITRLVRHPTNYCRTLNFGCT